jgi:hypothetical protein
MMTRRRSESSMLLLLLTLLCLTPVAAQRRRQQGRVHGAPKTFSTPVVLLDLVQDPQELPQQRRLRGLQPQGNIYNKNNVKVTRQKRGTSSPTVAPTSSPSHTPTAAPSQRITKTPTVVESSPTVEPYDTTTDTPTAAPTKPDPPTQEPSQHDIVAPTSTLTSTDAPTMPHPTTLQPSATPSAAPNAAPTELGIVPLLDFRIELSSSSSLDNVTTDWLETILEDYISTGLLLPQSVLSVTLQLLDFSYDTKTALYSFGGHAKFAETTPIASDVHAEQEALLLEKGLLENALETALGMELTVEEISFDDDSSPDRAISSKNAGNDSNRNSVILGSIVCFGAFAMAAGLVYYRHRHINRCT